MAGKSELMSPISKGIDSNIAIGKYIIKNILATIYYILYILYYILYILYIICHPFTHRPYVWAFITIIFIAIIFFQE